MRTGLLVSLLFATSMPAFAVDLTTEQKNAVENAAVLGIVMKSCPDFQISERVLAADLAAAKVRIDREPYASFASTKARETEAALSAIGPKNGCEVFFKLYGASGTARHGLMTRR
jgi:hypothetical protein